MTQKAIKHRSLRALVSYMVCVSKFPLKPIRTQPDYREALEILGQLAGRENLDPGQQDYLAALSHFVGDYEHNAIKFQTQSLKPLEALQYLMQQNAMTTTDLGHILRSRGFAPEVLSTKRSLSKTLIRRLAERFAVDRSFSSSNHAPTGK